MAETGACAVVLAGGLSTRMRPLLEGRSKALCLLAGRSLLAHCCLLFQKAGVENIYVVTGHDHEAVSTEAERLNALAVYNPRYREGMFSSVVTGVRGVLNNADNRVLFLLPVDIPLVDAATLEVLLSHWSTLTDNNKAIIIPEANGLPGHPPLIGKWHWERILDWTGGGGLQGYMVAEAVRATGAEKLVHTLAVPQPTVLWDIDRPGDLARLENAANSVHHDS